MKIQKKYGMICVENSLIPFKGCRAINICGILFCRNLDDIDEITVNHEKIHTAQCKEMLYLPFYIWYLIEYITLLINFSGTKHSAYRQIGFEEEAYNNEKDFNYLSKRKHYSWWKYAF